MERDWDGMMCFSLSSQDFPGFPQQNGHTRTKKIPGLDKYFAFYFLFIKRMFISVRGYISSLHVP